jgi:hypothetical protein
LLKVLRKMLGGDPCRQFFRLPEPLAAVLASGFHPLGWGDLLGDFAFPMTAAFMGGNCSVGAFSAWAHGGIGPRGPMYRPIISYLR